MLRKRVSGTKKWDKESCRGHIGTYRITKGGDPILIFIDYLKTGNGSQQHKSGEPLASRP